MEKTTQITIGGSQFQLTESAFENLRSYLERLKTRFDGEDGAEIMRDIEARIAEKLLEKKRSLVTADDIATVIADMGDASAFDDDHGDAHTSDTGARKLYRDTDDAIIAGVASGLASYFGINATLVRLLFLISLLFSGVGFAIYIVLWLLIPEAKTASQKLQMKGARVTLDSIAHIVQERVEEVQRRGAFSRAIRFPAEIVKMLGLGRLFRRILGFAFAAGSFLAFIAATALFGIVLTNWNASWNDIPHKEFIAAGLFKIFLLAVYVAVTIPVLFVFALGQRLFKDRTLFSSTIAFGLLGIWTLAIVGCGALGTKIAGDYYAHMSSSPDYAQTVDEHGIDAITAIDIRGTGVSVRSGDSYSVRISGRKIDMDNVSVTAASGTLAIRSVRHDDACLFCNRSIPSVTVTVPTLERIQIQSGSLSFDDLSVPSLALDLNNASISGSAKIPSFTLSADSSWSSLKIAASNVSLTADNSRVELEGTSDTLAVVARSSSVDTESMRARTATVDANNSSVTVLALEHFQVLNDRNSSIENASSTEDR